MARFRFHLESLLRLRHHAEEARKRDLAAALAAKAQAEAAVQALVQEGRQLEEDASRPGMPFEPAFRIQLGVFLAALADRIAMAKLEVLQKEEGVQTATSALNRAVRERKILERLKERKREEFKVEMAKRDQAALDEHAARFLAREGGLMRMTAEDDTLA